VDTSDRNTEEIAEEIVRIVRNAAETDPKRRKQHGG
jgi:hypothetical protein